MVSGDGLGYIWGIGGIAGYCPALQLFKAEMPPRWQRPSSAPSAKAIWKNKRANMRLYREEYSWHSIAVRTREIYENLSESTKP